MLQVLYQHAPMVIIPGPDYCQIQKVADLAKSELSSQLGITILFYAASREESHAVKKSIGKCEHYTKIHQISYIIVSTLQYMFFTAIGVYPLYRLW